MNKEANVDERPCELGEEHEIVIHLTADEAAVAKAMLARGDCISDVAYWFGVTEEELEQLINGTTSSLEPAPPEALPPPGPYPTISEVRSALAALEKALGDINVARAAIGLPPLDFTLPALRTDPRNVVEIEPATGEVHRLERSSTRLPGQRPAQYQPPKQKAPTAKSAVKSERLEAERERAFPIQVRLLMERGGFCRLTLLPKRTPEMPTEIEVTAGEERLVLTQLQDEWFDDIHISDLGSLLRDGIEWRATLPDGKSFRWLSSGRGVYVLGHHPDLSGFVSTTKVSLGQSHVVLCTSDLLPDVTRAITEGGSPSPVILGSDAGMPSGWIGLQGVIPRTPIASTEEADILNVLRADPDIQIILEGGIRIGRSSWLVGHPPRIRMFGQLPPGDRASVDRKHVQPDADGSLIVDGADRLGQHSVFCGNISRSYSIDEGLEHWEPWDAYCWSLGDISFKKEPHHPIICGPLIRSPTATSNGGRVLLLPALNELLLGAVPGEIDRSDSRADIIANRSIGLPWFNVVWAMPSNILHSNKQVAKILFVGDPHLLHSLRPRQRAVTLPGADPRSRRQHYKRIKEWCAAVLNAGQKGLQVDPPADEIAALWVAYKKCAKSIWRSLR
jgi:hypothetical protein